MNQSLDEILEYMKNQKVLTDLEKDIIETVNRINMQPFDRIEAIKKMNENNTRYPENMNLGYFNPNLFLKPVKELDDGEISNNLHMQLSYMVLKELKEIQKKKSQGIENNTSKNIF